MTKLWLAKDSYTEVTRQRNYDDQWSGEDTVTSWTFGNVTLVQPKHSDYDCFETPFNVKAGDPIILVIAVWSTGDSFSRRDREYSEVFGAFKTTQEAEEYAEKLKKGEVMDVFLPWLGYFDSLDYITCEGRVVFG